MKTITNPASITKYLTVILFMFQVVMFAQTDDPILTKTLESDSTIEIVEECTANDLSIFRLYLADINGVPITASCTPGTDQSAYIYAVFNETQAASRYSLLISYDLIINEDVNNAIPVEDCKFENQALPVQDDLQVQAINYKCGDRIELRNLYLRWHSAANKDCEDSYSPSKCYFDGPGLVVDAPLVANFSYDNPCNSLEVNFTDTTTGGDIENPYSYQWNFGDGNSSNEENPSHTYASANDYNVTLTVTDNDGVVDSQMYTVTVNPILTGLTLTPSAEDCSNNTNGSITASVPSGGVGPYTYSISPDPNSVSPSNSNVFNNLGAGDYTVTVTDSRNCTISDVTTVIVGDTTVPIITAPGNIDVEGCDTNDIQNDGLTALAYSASSVEMTAQQFQDEGGSYTEENLDTITYSDSATGSCPIVVTRTFVITDDCGQSASDTQTISIDDTTYPTFDVPGPVTISCDDDSSVANTGDISNVQDNCNVASTNHSDVTVAGSCPGIYVITRTFTVTDDCGNVTEKTQEITVEDNKGPEFTVPADTDASCEDISLATTGEVNDATDNCGNVVSLTHNDVITPGNCAGNYSIARTFTAIDECGNETKQTQTITVLDNVGPTFTVPADTIASCEDISKATTGDVTDASDNCGTVSVTSNDVVSPGNCAGNYTIARTFTATDDCGNETKLTQTITVQDNEGPTFDLPANITVSCEDTSTTVTGDISNVMDNCSAIESSSYVDVIVPGSCDGNYTIERTFTVADECGNETSLMQSITVQDIVGPTFDAPANTTVSCADTSISAAGNISNVMDNCSGIASSTHNDVIIPGNCPGNYTIERTFTVIDGCDNVTEKTQTITVEDDEDPTLITPASPIDISCSANGNDGEIEAWLNDNGGARATDNCTADEDLVWTNNYGSANADCSNPVEVTFTATDSCGRSVSTTATYQISDDEDPSLDIPAGDMTVECDGVGNQSDLDLFLSTQGGAKASDSCSAISWSNDFVALTDDCGATGSALVTFTARDACGREVSTSATFTIEDTTDPDFDVPADITISCEQDDQNLDVTGRPSNESDSCSDLLKTVFVDEIIPSGVCDGNYEINRTFTVTDECGRSTSKIQKITVQDITTPTFTVPGDITIECDQDINDLDITGRPSDETDNCSELLKTEFSDQSVDGDCPIIRVVTRTFTVTDECGNFATGTQIITVQDSTAPVITVEAQPIDITCSADGNNTQIQDWLNDNGGARASDNCTADDDLVWTNDYGNVNADCSNPVEVTFTVTDSCGRSASTTATYQVSDNENPTIDIPASDMTVECDGAGNQADLDTFLSTRGGAMASDTCSAITWTNNFTEVSDGCGATGSVEVTFTATDGCNKIATTTATFTIEDTTPPLFTSNPVPGSAECDGEGNAQDLQNYLDSFGDAVAEDGCSSVTITSEIVEETDNCGSTKVFSIKFTATDECGIQSEAMGSFSIVDTTPPVIEVEAQTVSMECGPDTDQMLADWLANNGNAVVSDNCSENIEWSSETNGMSDTCGATGSMTVIFTAEDECGNKASTTASFAIVDTTAPMFTVPESTSIECDADPNDLTITGDVTDESDNCSSNLEASYADEVSEGGECPILRTITRTWTLMDECGNTNTQQQIITVQDTTAPTFTVPPSVTLACADDIDDMSLAGDVTDEADNCTVDGLDATFSDEMTAGDCPNSFSIVRTWTLMDACGNTNTQTQSITVEDTEAPKLDGDLETSVSVSCDAIPSVPSLVFVDNCSSEVDVQFNDVTSEEVEEEYTITREWTVTDECNNSDVFTQVITVTNTPVNIAAGSLSLCPKDIAVDLFDTLDPSAPSGGTFSIVDGIAASINGSMFDPTFYNENTSYTINYNVDSVEGECPINYQIAVSITPCIVLPPPTPECPEDESEVEISQAVTPNGDGINDVFEVGGFEPECGFEVELTIFNRWGAEIYKNNNYQNDWGAEASNASIGNSNLVPTGTYYYIINLKNSDFAPFSGPIYVGTK